MMAVDLHVFTYLRVYRAVGVQRNLLISWQFDKNE